MLTTVTLALSEYGEMNILVIIYPLLRRRSISGISRIIPSDESNYSFDHTSHGKWYDKRRFY